MFSLFCASLVALKLSLLLSFLIGRFCMHLHPELRFYKFSQVFLTAFRIGSHLQSQLHLVQFQPTLAAPSTVPWFTSSYVSFIVLELHYMIALSKEYFEIIQASHILKQNRYASGLECEKRFSKFLVAKHDLP